MEIANQVILYMEGNSKREMFFMWVDIDLCLVNMKYLPPLIETLDESWKIGNAISDAQLSSLTKKGKI